MLTFCVSRLSIPFITQRIYLVREFGKVLIRAALIMLNDGKQSLPGRQQTFEYGRYLALLLCHDAYSFGSFHNLIIGKVVAGSRIGCIRIE